jgi:hypothetical protein
MVRRWLIRVPFLLALAFIVGVWIASYFGAITAVDSRFGNLWQVTIVQGLDDFDKIPLSMKPGMEFRFLRHDTAKDRFVDDTTFGFDFGENPVIPGMWRIVFPMWLPAIVLSLLNWFVWRKTRGRSVGGAFVVEVAGGLKA